MPERVDWVKWYGNERERYKSFTSKLRHLIELILQNGHIESSIESRTKTLESFSEKVNRDGKAYLDPPSEITDLSGIRIIVRTKGDLEKVSQTLQSEFNIDSERSVNKSDLLQSNEFGYFSEHYVISIALNRSKLTEWAPFVGMVAEIQIRTILQHAWASISHKIEYKKSIDIPKELRRRFFRLSALFELADDELDSIVIGSNQLYKEYVEKIQSKVTVVEINVDSLRAYLESSERVQFWAKFIESLGV